MTRLVLGLVLVATAPLLCGCTTDGSWSMSRMLGWDETPSQSPDAQGRSGDRRASGNDRAEDHRTEHLHRHRAALPHDRRARTGTLPRGTRTADGERGAREAVPDGRGNRGGALLANWRR